MTNYPVGGFVLADFQKALYDWCKDRLKSVIEPSGIIWRNQSEPLPPRPCVTLKVIDGPKRVGFQDNTVYIAGSDGQFIVGGQRVVTVSIQIFGNTHMHRPMAFQLAIDLNSSLSLQTVLDQLRCKGIGVLEQGDPNNITALEETEYEERAQFDVLFSVAQNIVDTQGTIEHVGPIYGP